MYYEYWGLQKAPFDNVPDPSMYVDCHASMETAIAETVFAIEEGDECMAVIVGDVGLGKTMSLRMIIDSLDQEKYKIALVTNPGISFVQILQEIIGQLTGTQCEEKRKVNLLEIFNRLLFTTIDEGKKILIMIDEANAITPVNLESLRLLTNMQGDRRNLFTIVLAGQLEFGKRLEHPKRANLFQRVGTYSRIDKLESATLVKKYVETRLTRAGATTTIFTENAFDKIWEHSDHGIPRLINKLSKLCLKAGETNSLTVIGGDIVDQIGARFQKLTGPLMQKRISRLRTQPESPQEMALEPEGPDEQEIGEAFARELEIPEEETAADTVFHAVQDEPAVQEPAALTSAETAPAAPAEYPAAVMASPVAQEHTLPDALDEMEIGACTIRIDFPEPLIRQSLSSTRENRLKLAGALAAETLKKNPQLLTSYAADPVPVWQEIRDFVLNRFERQMAL